VSASSDHRQDRWALRIVLVVAIALATLLMATGLAVLGYGHYYGDRILPGLSVQQVQLGGLTRQQALARLEHTLVDQELPYVRLRAEDQAWIYSVTSLGGSMDFTGAVEQAWQIGRAGIFREDSVTRALLLWQGYNIVPAFVLEPGLSTRPLRQIALQAGTAPRRAQVWVAGLDVNNYDARAGRDLDVAAAQAAIVASVTEALGSSAWSEVPRWRLLLESAVPRTGHFPDDPIPVTLSFMDLNPGMSELSAAFEQAAAVLSAPVTLSFSDPVAPGATESVPMTWAVDRATLASWLVISEPPEAGGTVPSATIDREALLRYVAQLAVSIDRPARQGRFDYDPASALLTMTTPEQTGRSLDQVRAADLLEAACLDVADRTVTLPVTITDPPVTQAQLQAMLPLDLISTGETSFAGSSAARLHNIVVATAQFQGVAAAAHSRFSFVDHVGLVTIAAGYAEGWVIMGDETVLGPGGGVCQVGTTFFRAAFWGGYPIAERTPHAYRVSWYEPPVGLDAAVYTPYVDIKFDNDQPTPILIQTDANQESGKLVFRFYGRAPGRQVTIEGPTLGAITPAGEPVVEVDPALAPGERFQVESAHDGVEVTVYRLITVNGTIASRERFYSKYAPWPARYREGPASGGTAP
jgi:vancomycin resistance protein YoaR